MDPIQIIQKFYDPRSRAYAVLVDHGRRVADEALEVARRVPHLNPDLELVREAAMLHDIGMFRTRVETLGCYGRDPYIRHGYLGAKILAALGLPDHAAVCERHVGAGLLADEIRRQNLPLPQRDMVPQRIEELIVAYADKFFSKADGAAGKKSPAAVLNELARYGEGPLTRFRSWMALVGRR